MGRLQFHFSPEVLNLVLLNLYGSDLGRASCVCTSWRDAVRPNQPPWKRAYLDEFGPPSCSVDLDAHDTNWKEQYVKQWTWRFGTISANVLVPPLPCWLLRAWGNLVVISGMKEVFVWDSDLRRLKLSIEAHEGLVVAVAVEGPLLCTAGIDGLIRVWCLDTGERQFEVRSEIPNIRDLVIHGGQLMVAMDHKVLQSWDLSSYSCTCTRRNLAHTLRHMKVSPDGLWVLGTTTASSVVVMDAKSKADVATLLKVDEIVTSIDISVDFAAIAVKTDIHTFIVPTWMAGSLMRESRDVSCVKMMEKLLISGCDGGSIKLWDAEMGVCIREIAKDSPGLAVYIFLTNYGFVAGSRLDRGLLSVSEWETKAAKELASSEIEYQDDNTEVRNCSLVSTDL